MGAKYQPVQTSDDNEFVDRGADTDRDIELGDSVPPAYSNNPDEVPHTNDASSSPFSNAELMKRAPSAQGTNADVRAFIQLLLQRRGESFDMMSDDISSTSSRDIRYLTGADLHSLEEKELVEMLPEAWPPVLRTLVAKDVKRFTDWTVSKTKKFFASLVFLLFVVSSVFGIVMFVKIVSSKLFRS